MAQKIDIQGLFIDPESITDLLLQKRISVFYPVFYEVEKPKSFFGRFAASNGPHLVQFDHQEPYGIILNDEEQPDMMSYAMTYKQKAFAKLWKDVGRTGKNIAGHIAETLKVDTAGDRQYRILQPGRHVKQISIREIPAKVRLLSGQWVDVFKSSPEYDFQGGTPYAVTDVTACALKISLKDNTYALFGAGVDGSNEEIQSAYHALTTVYNEIQVTKQEAEITQKTKKSPFPIPQINPPKLELPKIDIPIIIQAPFVLKKKETSKDAMLESSVSQTVNEEDES